MSDNQSKKKIKAARRAMLEKLEEDLSKSVTIENVSRHYFKISLTNVHKTHPVGEAASVSHCVDSRIIKKIHELVESNITTPDMIRKCLDDFVNKELFPDAKGKPTRSNRRYYPTRQDLRNHIAKAISVKRYSKDDQESLRKKVEEWEKSSPTSNFYLRTRDERDGDDEATFLFIHQEEWQRRLLMRYGSDLVLMDATYKTTKYAIPLFFVCVHTNVGYKVVAEFMCQNEEAHSIAEALFILREWSPTWQPKYFMIDFCASETDAIEQVFPDVAVYICDFHRIQAWQRWSKASKNGLSADEQSFFINTMQKIAYSRTKEAYEKGVEALRKSQLYKNPRVRYYCDQVWLPCAKRWAHAFRQQQVANIVNTNNGVERQNHLFKYDYLPRSIDKSVYGIALILVESFVPDSYQQYLDTNLKLSSCYRRYSSMVPDYLHNRPAQFVKHCLKSQFDSGSYRENDIKCVNIEKGEFLVRSESQQNRYFKVQFDQPSCQCDNWCKTQYPCKHFYAIFHFYDDWTFSKLPVSYRNSVFLNLDTTNFDTSTCPKPTIPDKKISDKQRSKENDSFQTHSVDAPGTTATNNVQCETSRVPNTLKSRRILMERLDNLKSLLFLVDNQEVLEDAAQTLEELTSSLREHCPNQDGLPLRQSPAKKRLKTTSVDYHKVFHKKLPMRKKYKRKDKNPKVVVDLTIEEAPGTIVTEEVILHNDYI